MDSITWKEYMARKLVSLDDQSAVPMPTDRIVKVAMTHKEESMEAWILPEQSDAVWPSFIGGSKQIDAAGKKLLMVRTSELDISLYNLLFKYLVEGRSCVVFGSAGTGKTSGLNVLKVRLFNELLQKHKLKEVAHRVNGRIFLYSLNESTNAVDCTGSERGANLEDIALFCYSREDTRESMVLILELDERETDPRTMGVPTLIAVSAREETTSVVKEISKGGGGIVRFLQSPPTPAEVHMLAKALYCVDKGKTLHNAELPSDTSEESFLKTIDERVSNIGGIVRDTLNNGRAFSAFLEERASQAVFINSAVLTAMKCDYKSMPRATKYFFAAHAVDSCDQTDIGSCKFQYLSDEASLVLAENHVFKEEDIATLTRVGLAYQCAEAVLLKYGLHAHTLGFNNQGNSLLSKSWNSLPKEGASRLPIGFDRKKWELFDDPGCWNRLTDKFRRRTTLTSFLELLPGYDNPELKLFRTMYLDIDVGELPCNTVWRRTVGDVPVGECLFVHTDVMTGLKIVTFFCCISMRNKDFTISVSALRSWFEKLHLFKAENLEVKVRIVALSDWCQESEFGLKFTGTSGELAATGDDASAVVGSGEMDITGLRTNFKEIGARLETYIVRAGIYPQHFGAARRKVPRDKPTKTPKTPKSKPCVKQ